MPLWVNILSSYWGIYTWTHTDMYNMQCDKFHMWSHCQGYLIIYLYKKKGSLSLLTIFRSPFFGNIIIYILQFSWRHALTHSLMTWGTQMHVCLMGEHYLICSILQLKVSSSSALFLFILCLRFLFGADAKILRRIDWCICRTATSPYTWAC